MAHGQGQPDVSTVPSFLRRPFKHGGEVGSVVGFGSGERFGPDFPEVGLSASSLCNGSYVTENPFCGNYASGLGTSRNVVGSVATVISIEEEPRSILGDIGIADTSDIRQVGPSRMGRGHKVFAQK